jgi:ammonium transporter, Amt family
MIEGLFSTDSSLEDAADCVDAGDTAWVLISAVLILGMMPALAFFESGLLRRKNTLSIITEVFVGLAIMQIMWYMGGFSLVYGPDKGGFIGGLDYIFMINLGYECLPNAPTIPGLAFASFQSMFAAVTPLLMTGAIAERMKFRSFLLFIILWEILVYYPLAHW